ncbi:unnamed protein product [Candidula unifasciata]|uniref:G-protein coupled receptors family 1 profile domain-containing protein n=1 Tax=Candidula unifasciata TaxID=100452 RepID=A0A8S3ZVW3_9EUPU|nr:unnamed protein product [Candidula unifasciata]
MAAIISTLSTFIHISCTIAYANRKIINNDNSINNNQYINKFSLPEFSGSSKYAPDADHVTDFVHWTFVFIVTPSISVLGIVGNTFSVIVLAKHGFRKSSNILLFTLAISDILFMIGWGAGGFQYPEPSARILYYFYHIFDSLNWGSGPASLCIPPLITIERLIAVFLPLRFPSIVTPRRTIIAALIPNLFFYGIQIYVRTWFQFAYVFDISRNASVGIAIRTGVYWSQRHVSKALEIVVNSLIGLVIFVGFGCVAIGIKVKLAAIRRLKMTNSTRAGKKTRGDHSTSRTTKMLLCLCVFYTIVCSPISLSTIMPDLMVFPVFIENPNFRSVGVFVYHIYKFLFAVNGSVNFVIYVAMCKNFRDTFLDLFRRK